MLLYGTSIDRIPHCSVVDHDLTGTANSGDDYCLGSFASIQHFLVAFFPCAMLREIIIIDAKFRLIDILNGITPKHRGIASQQTSCANFDSIIILVFIIFFTRGEHR